MESRYELLVSVVYRHEFFPNRKFDKLSTEPTSSTREALTKNGLLFRCSPDGFRIFFDTRWAGGVRERETLLQEAQDLLFLLTLHDADFYHYTDLDPGDITRSFFYLSNESPGGGERVKPELLHEGDFVTENDRVYFSKLPQHFFGKPFGWLQLTLNAKLTEVYEARWPVRSVYWKYIVVSQHLKELNKPAIIDPVTKQVFAGPEPILLPDNRSALSFVSETPISFLTAEKQLFQLVENFEEESGRYKVVLSALPHADPRILSDVRDAKDRKAKKATAYFSEIFIY